MKLRSGKVIGKKELPIVLQNELNSNLEDFKELLMEHKEVAREILRMIAEARSFETVYKVERTLQKAAIPDDNQALGVTYGSLVGLVIGNHNFYPDHNIAHIYHDEVKERILSFLDYSLTGDHIQEEI